LPHAQTQLRPARPGFAPVRTKPALHLRVCRTTCRAPTRTRVSVAVHFSPLMPRHCRSALLSCPDCWLARNSRCVSFSLTSLGISFPALLATPLLDFTALRPPLTGVFLSTEPRGGARSHTMQRRPVCMSVLGYGVEALFLSVTCIAARPHRPFPAHAEQLHTGKYLYCGYSVFYGFVYFSFMAVATRASRKPVVALVRGPGER
jgi:hypothetical protein